MKRQRGVVGVNGVNPMNINPPRSIEEVVAVGKKKAKKEGSEQKKSVVVVVKEEERKVENREVGVGGTVSSHGVVGLGSWEEYMPWLGGVVVDEQMSWGSTWFPGWDMDFMGEAFTALYSDVVWDDDIWNLNKEIPIPLHGKRFNWE